MTNNITTMDSPTPGPSHRNSSTEPMRPASSATAAGPSTSTDSGIPDTSAAASGTGAMRAGFMDAMEDMDPDSSQDICRVCRCEAAPDRPLFYPCVCTGSIKYIHQDCLTQWLRYSRKEYCELCNHRFSFTPIYAPDMPKRLPIRDIITGLLSSVGTAFRFWFHYTLVAFAWLGVVPLSACRIHRSLFTGSVSSILSLPLDLLSTENIVMDIFHGCVVVMCALSVFISLIWLREHILQGGGPEWLMDPPIPEEINEVPDPEHRVGQQGEDQELVVEDENGNQQHVFVNDNEGNPAGNPGVQNPNAVVGAIRLPRRREREAAAAVANDDLNWPMDWDRAGEELTWEKLLGLDGSLLFLEHVFWVVSLNTLCILVFEFSPYHIGYFSLAAFNLHDWTTQLQLAQFDGMLTTLMGYFIIGLSLVVLHTLATLLKFKKCRKILGISYIVIKVCLLSVVEIGIFPLVCGWWLDICSLPLFDATLRDREASFSKAPGTSMFMHWLFGMIYVFYFASFILILREVLRPGVLWFMRNINDPDFNPIQEMIHLPIFKHVRRFLFSIIIFGTTTLLMVWVPIRIIKRVIPTFLPYSFAFTTESAHEMSLELVLLQVMMPALLEQGHTREWIKAVIRAWCICLSWFLGFRSYLLGDVDLATGAPATANGNAAHQVQIPVPVPAPVNANNDNMFNDEINEDFDLDPNDDLMVDALEELGNEGVNIPAAGLVDPEVGAALAPGLGFAIGGAGLGAAHQALIMRGGPTGYYPYHRPRFFHIKIVILLLSICVTITIVSLGILTIPVGVGRTVMSWSLQTKGEPIHELYTSATGLYVTWLTIRLLILLCSWIPKGWNVVWNTMQKWSVTISKTAVAMGLLIGVIPFLSGLLFELVVITPLRIPLQASPLHMYSENWVMGTLYIKIACATIMMSPQHFWLRRTLERIYNNGIRNINLNLIIRELAAPCIVGLGLALTVPYVISHSIVPIFVTNLETQNLVARRIYPFLLVIAVSYGMIIFQIRQFTKLYEHIKNDKYLVGRRLVNYERPSSNAATTTAGLPATS